MEFRSIHRGLAAILPHDLSVKQTGILRGKVKVEAIHGFILDKAVTKKLRRHKFNDRYRETLRTLDDYVAEETNRRKLVEIEEQEDQWVPHDEGYESDIGPTSERELERFELLSTQEVPYDPGDSDQHEETSFSSEEKDETCFAVYYPMIGVFKSKEKLKSAYERTKRPVEEIEVESQAFDTPETAVDAILRESIPILS